MFNVTVWTGYNGPRMVDDQVLYENLPRVARMANTGYLDINLLLHDSELIRQGSLTREQVVVTWDIVMKGLAARSRDCSGLTLDLRDMLSEAFRRDRNLLSHPSNFVGRYPQSLQLFMSLAEVSSIGESRPIASALAGFFGKHGEEIVRSDYQNLDLWGESILRAYMSQADKLNCLREFLVANPRDLDAMALQNPRSEVATFLNTLAQLDFHQEQSLDLASFPSRGRPFLRGCGPVVHRTRPNINRSHSVPSYQVYRDPWDTPYQHQFANKSYRNSPAPIASSSSDADLDLMKIRMNRLENKVIEHELGAPALAVPTFQALPAPRSLSPGYELAMGGYGRRHRYA